MPRLTSIECPSCHASLSVPADAREIDCQYCGRHFQVQPEAPRWVKPTSSAGLRYLVPMIALSLTITAGSAGFILFASGGDSAQMDGPVRSLLSDLADRGASGLGNLQIDSLAPPKVSDGVLVVRTRRHTDGASQVMVGAWNAADLAPLWLSDPLGDWSEDDAHRFVHAAPSQGRVAVARARGGVQVLDLRSGEEQALVATSDRVTELCVSGPGRVWAGLLDEQHIEIDLASGAASPHPGRPEACPARVVFGPCHSMLGFDPQAHCEDADDTVEGGFQATWRLSSGGDALEVGERAPGTAIPLVRPVDGSWAARPVPAGDPADAEDEAVELVDLVDGRLVALYELRNGSWRLTALDATTGETLWDSAVPRSNDGSDPTTMWVGADAVYVPHWVWLDVFELDSGALRGTIGRW